jgi:hypothetical protein
LAETVATWRISSRSLTFLEMLGELGLTAASTALSIPRLRKIGLAPAVTFLRPSLVDGLGEHGGGGGAIARGVAGLGSDFLHHLGAHVFVGIGKLDFLGHGHAVLGDGRGTEFLVEHDIAALGPEGDFDGLGEELDAAEDFLTSGSSKRSCLAAMWIIILG